MPTPGQLPLPCAPLHPDVVDARRYAANFQLRFDALQQAFIEMQRYRFANGNWPPQVAAYATQLSQLGGEIDSVPGDRPDCFAEPRPSGSGGSGAP